MRRRGAALVAKLANALLTRLRNGVPTALTREEIRFAQISFSQFGEDMAVLRWVDRLGAPPVYVDVGCFHPIHFSNTLLLHKRGWRGVNVDLDERRIALFDRLRPGDHNVAAALSDGERDLKVVLYGAGLTDRLAPPGEAAADSLIGERPVGERAVRTRTLQDVLRTCPWPVDRIGYLNIDCEGHDIEVLRGIDLGAFRPAVVTIEAFPGRREAVVRELESHGYSHVETLHHTLLFVAGAC